MHITVGKDGNRPEHHAIVGVADWPSDTPIEAISIKRPGHAAGNLGAEAWQAGEHWITPPQTWHTGTAAKALLEAGYVRNIEPVDLVIAVRGGPISEEFTVHWPAVPTAEPAPVDPKEPKVRAPATGRANGDIVNALGLALSVVLVVTGIGWLNRGPGLNPDSITTVWKPEIPIDVLANDQNAAGGLLLRAVTPAANGTTGLSPDQRLVLWRPERGYQGTVLFRYFAADASGHTSEAPVSVTIQAQPELTAVPDTVSRVWDAAIAIPVLDNDRAVAGGLRVVAAEGAVHGSVAPTADGLSVAYRPHKGAFGHDEFRYRITDSADGFAQAPVTVEITAPELIARPDQAQLAAKASSLTIAVTHNDSAGAGGLHVTAATGASHGTVEPSSDGKAVIYRPGASRAADTFTYRITDDAGGNAQAQVTVAVEPPMPRARVQSPGEEDVLEKWKAARKAGRTKEAQALLARAVNGRPAVALSAARMLDPAFPKSGKMPNPDPIEAIHLYRQAEPANRAEVKDRLAALANWAEDKSRRGDKTARRVLELLRKHR